MEIDKKYSIDA